MITAMHRLTMQSHMSYLSCSCFVCLTGPYKFEYLVLEQLTFGSLSTILSYCMFNMAPHGKELSEDLRIRIVALHKDGFGLYEKFGNTLTVQWPGSYRGFPRSVSLGTGLARIDQRS